MSVEAATISDFEIDESTQRDRAEELRQRAVENKRLLNSDQKTSTSLISSKPSKWFMNKIINFLLPEYAAAKILVFLMVGKKSDYDLADKIIMMFSLAIIFLLIFGALAMIVMIMGWISNPLKAISDLGFSAVTALANLFANLIK